MIARLIALAASPALRGAIVRLGSTFIFAFVATAGSIWARRVHKDDQPRKWRQP